MTIVTRRDFVQAVALVGYTHSLHYFSEKEVYRYRLQDQLLLSFEEYSDQVKIGPTALITYLSSTMRL